MKKILIAENKQNVRDLLKIVFRLSGYKKIYYAKNSHSCLKKIKRIIPDLILLDENIQGNIDIGNMLTSIKNDRSMDSCNVILLSENSNEKDKREFIDKGVSDLITSKFKPLELMEKVENCIGGENEKKVNAYDKTISFSTATFQPILYSEMV